jgi:hypothetical protein
MAYAAKDFSKLIGMEGFSETLLKNHFTLYQGYVTNTNKLQELLGSKAKDATNPERNSNVASVLSSTVCDSMSTTSRIWVEKCP